jgi:hypothetical protein
MKAKALLIGVRHRRTKGSRTLVALPTASQMDIDSIAPDLSAMESEVIENQEESFFLYQCRCSEAKTNAGVICRTHSLSSRLPVSHH